MKLLPTLLSAVFFFGLLLSGCTVHFKATDAEFQGEVVKAYDLESIDIARAR